MSISKNNLQPSGSSVQSGARSSNSKITNWVCATLFAGLILFGSNAKAFNPYNVLVNPGAETGNFTGWHQSLSGYMFVDSTNQTVPNDTNTHLLAHSGSHVFRTFNTTSSRTYMYQDYAAVAGSRWSASVYAICYASNYVASGIKAAMQVGFYDATNGLIYSTNSYSGSAGIYGTDLLDPVDNSGLGVYWTIVPPPAVDASGWVYLIPTNLFNTDPCTTAGGYDGLPGVPITTNLLAPAGTAFIRYQIEFDNTAFNGGVIYWDDCVLQKLNQTDPDITNPQPADVTIFGGQPATFTVVGVKALKAEVLTYQWQKDGTNLPINGGVYDINGTATNFFLNITNAQAADAGYYSCVVSDAGGSIRTVPAKLTVLCCPPPPPPPNRLGNNGFEYAPVWAPWIAFNGCYFVCATNTYDNTNLVNILDGNWSAMIGANGDRDNGVYQIVTGVNPGTYWKAGAWAYISSFNDFAGYNTERIQIWFKDANGTTVPGTPVYESFKIYGLAYTNVDQLPRDQWCCLPVTNIVDANDLPWSTLTNGIFMVPTNTTPAVAQINFQIYELCPVANDNLLYTGVATDAVYWDDCYLIQILPVTNFTASVSGTNVNLSFWANPGLSYEVQYKTNLFTGLLWPMPDADWSVLVYTNTFTNFYGKTITVSDPIRTTPITNGFSEHRFYRVKVQ